MMSRQNASCSATRLESSPRAIGWRLLQPRLALHPPASFETSKSSGPIIITGFMDSPRKIKKSKSLTPRSRRKSSKLVIKTSNVKAQEKIEDRRLRNWRKWLANRERTCERLQSLTGRKPEDLLINSYEKIRPKIAIQNLLEAVAESVLPEKSRNDLSFWTTPEYLKNRRDPENPELAVSLTKKNLKIPRTVSRVFLPQLTQREKCLSLLKPLAQREKHNEYLRRKLKELSPEISKFNLKIGDIDQVAIEGKKIPDKQRIILRINDEEMIFDDFSMKKSRSIPLSLEFFSKKSEKSKRFICLENKTFENVIYEWQEPVSHYNELARMRPRRFFHFEKPSDIILPGRRGELMIWYQPLTPGVHLESIILETLPRLSLLPIVLRLWGVCEEPSGFPNRIIHYEDYLNLRFRNTVISEIIEGIWERVESPPPQYPPHALYFLESEVFAAKNPGFLYHPETVDALKKMFESLVGRDPWALSLADLRYHILRVQNVIVRSEMLDKFGKLCWALKETRKWELLTCSRHQVVFNLVSGFVSKFSVESEYVKSQCTWSGWGGFKSEGVQEDRSSCSESHGVDEYNSLGMRERGRTTALSASTGSIVSEGREYWDSGGQDERIYDTRLYCEVFYARIYHLLGDTVGKISAAIDGINNSRTF